MVSRGRKISDFQTDGGPEVFYIGEKYSVVLQHTLVRSKFCCERNIASLYLLYLTHPHVAISLDATFWHNTLHIMFPKTTTLHGNYYPKNLDDIISLYVKIRYIFKSSGCRSTILWKIITHTHMDCSNMYISLITLFDLLQFVQSIPGYIREKITTGHIFSRWILLMKGYGILTREAAIRYYDMGFSLVTPTINPYCYLNHGKGCMISNKYQRVSIVTNKYEEGGEFIWTGTDFQLQEFMKLFLDLNIISITGSFISGKKIMCSNTIEECIQIVKRIHIKSIPDT